MPLYIFLPCPPPLPPLMEIERLCVDVYTARRWRIDNLDLSSSHALCSLSILVLASSLVFP